LYAYRVAALRALAAAPPAAIEQRERLEQLRALALGLAIVVADASEVPGPGVDSAQDLARVEALLQAEPAP
jgi:3-deoxy-manno-octulosonate cytidylyltransferase (CMP-KDO synthetase)